MTKVVRTLVGGGLAALLAAVILGGAGLFSPAEVEAQAPPARPARFAGSVLVNGAPPAAGTSIEARINGTTCGVTTTFNEGGQSRYAFDVQAEEPTGELDCGTDGATVSFWVGGQQANETGVWRDYDINVVNLTVTTATPTGTATTPTGTGTATATGTPKPPVTGTGTAGESSPLWALTLIGAGIVAFSAGGFAVARRGR